MRALHAQDRPREARLMASRQQLLPLDPQAVATPSLDTISAALRRQDRALVTYFVDDPWLWVGLVVLSALGLALLWRGRDRLPEPFCNIGRPA